MTRTPYDKYDAMYGYLDVRKIKRIERKAGVSHPVDAAYYEGLDEGENHRYNSNSYPAGLRREAYDCGFRIGKDTI